MICPRWSVSSFQRIVLWAVRGLRVGKCARVVIYAGMNSDIVLGLVSELLKLAMVLSLPLLAVILVVGLSISVLQVVTQIQDPSISFVPKGMMMVPPVSISLPLKVMLFVLIDGWSLLLRAIAGVYA